MVRWSLALAAAVAVVAAGALLAQCTTPPDSGEAGPGLRLDAQQGADLLAGTWLREYAEQGVQVRRLLTLEPQGAFREVARVTDAEGRETRFVHEGTWLFDGTNLKRRYTLMDGKPPSRLNVPFATFEIAFESRNEFTGADHIHKHSIRYRRVDPGTAP